MNQPPLFRAAAVHASAVGKKEISFGLVLMILSTTVFALTFQFPDQTIALPPTAFPRFVSTCLFILAAILFVQGGMALKRGEQVSASDLSKGFWVRLLSMIVLAFVYVQVLPLVGYLFATPPFVAGSMRLFNEKRWGWILVISIGTSALLYIVFRMLFKVPLPRGNLW